MFGSILEKMASRGVHYYGELFGAYSSRKEIGIITPRYPIFGLRYVQIFLRQRRTGSQHPFALEEVGIDCNRVFRAMSDTAGVHVVKIFPRHVTWDTLEKVLEEIRPHVIFIRRNHRERALSLERAKASGKWARQAYGEQEVEITESNLKDFQSTTENWYRNAKMTACRLGLSIDDVDYRDLLNPAELRELVSHITEIPSTQLSDDELRPSTTKQGKDEPVTDFQFEKYSCCTIHSDSV